MRASVHLLTGCVALGLALPTIQSQAAAPLAGGLAAASSSLGQFGGKSETRRQADDLLKRARQAVKDAKYDKAETLIAQAEKLGVKYNPLTDRFVDKPETLRKLLKDEQARAGKQAAKPSSKFPALMGREAPKPQVPASPFAGQNQDSAIAEMTDGNKAKALSFAQLGRQALERGDMAGAKGFYQKATAFAGEFSPEEYSPQKLGADLTNAGVDIAQLAAAGTDAASPFTLRPSDVPSTADEHLPTLPASRSPADLARTTPAENLATGSVSDAPMGDGNSVYQVSDDPASEPQRLPSPPTGDKAAASRLVAQAIVAKDRGDLKSAWELAEQAAQMNVPDSAFGQNEPLPWQVANAVEKALMQRQGVVPAAASAPAGEEASPRYPVTQGVYTPEQDNTKMVPASTQGGGSVVTGRTGGPNAGLKLYDEGIKALEKQDLPGALEKFSQAWKYADQFDPDARQQLKDKLTFLRTAAAQATPAPVADGQPSPLEQVNSQQEILRQKMVREILAEQKTAEKIAQKDPLVALDNLKKLRERVAGTEVEPAAKKQMLTIVDRSISELSTYIEQNKATIDNRNQNAKVREDVARDREVTIETQQKLADLVEKFNTLIDERRYPEAEVVAKQAREVAPDNPVTETLVWKSRFIRNIAEDEDIVDKSQIGFNAAMLSVGESGIPFDDREPWKIGDADKWEKLTRDRRKWLADQRKLSPAEAEIQKALGKPVELKFENRPLTEVMDTLSKMSGVNIHLNPTSLHSEGITSDTPVTLNLENAISLRSALSLILGPMRLSYIIRNEVLEVTSEATRDSNTYAKVYYVADLVIPIPNFVPSYNMGLPGALRESLNSLGYGGRPMPVSSGPLTIASDEEKNLQPQSTNPNVLAQQAGFNVPGTGGGGRPNQVGAGPGGMGGGVVADFDTLIELITTTISPDSWDDVGGPGSIAQFDTNLSLVISQTQEIHEKIADLLEQLRRLQDLQVTIEVRFITLADRFFERIGIDFDFNIDDNSTLNAIADRLVPARGELDDGGPTVAFGLTQAGTPTPTLDLQFQQGSFASTRPQFGNFDPNTAGTFGFAILSDIEAFFLLEAAQGDDRTNVLQAPKVTLFNGQQAFVSDTSQRPFVISVIPVVGDFAAAHQPVIVVLNEGTSLSVQAVVSADRRFVRLTLVPFFSRIGDVDTFTFNGKVTTTTGTSVKDPTDDKKTNRDGAVTTTEGTTVQLPTFAFTSVITTVSVPDGGTVLLGGIKRLREGRNERGIPLASKIPYISRLFRNVGIGRDAQSLMMMVTPRIIIQEEEEEKLGINLEP